MSIRQQSMLFVCATAWSLWGCGDTPETMQPGVGQPPPQTGTPADTPPPMAAATAGSAAVPVSPALPPAGMQPMMQPAPSTGAAGGPSAMMPPAAKPPEAPMMEDPNARPGDSCTDRRVSYTKPCTPDPDPCKLNSGWAGDEYCLKPPAEGEGIQIHIGPKDYKNMAEVMKYVIQPEEEFNNSVIGHIPLSESKWWNRITVHMRPGSHHWISSVVQGKPEEKFYNDTSCAPAMQIGSLGGGQNLIYDNPPGGKPAPENEGLGRQIQGDSSLCMNLHAYNFSDKPMLREMWINIYFVDEAKVTQRASGIGIVGGLGLNLAPGQSLEQTYSQKFTGDSRIIQLFGHRHVWTPRFAVWLNERLIYDSWSWEESATFNYDSLTMNPPIQTDKKVDGAVSGVLDVKAGDTLKFTCFIENKSADKTLRFSNELYDGEMCNLWGSAVGTGLSGTKF